MNAVTLVAKRWALSLISEVADARATSCPRRTPRGFQPIADGLPERIAPAVFVPPPSDYCEYGY